MDNTKIDVVDLETAKAIKEKGFVGPTYYFYIGVDLPFVPKGLYRVKSRDRRMNHNKHDDHYSAPTIKEYKSFIKKLKK